MKRLTIIDPWAKTSAPSKRVLSAGSGKFCGFALSGQTTHDLVLLKLDGGRREMVLRVGEVLPYSTPEVEVAPIRADHADPAGSGFTVMQGVKAANATVTAWTRIAEVGELPPGAALPVAKPIDLLCFESELELRTYRPEWHPWACRDARTTWDATDRYRYILPFAGRRNAFLHLTDVTGGTIDCNIIGARYRHVTADRREVTLISPAPASTVAVVVENEGFDVLIVHGQTSGAADTVELYAEAD